MNEQKKSAFLSNLVNETLEHGFFRLWIPFVFYSAKFRCTITMPAMFVHDKESVPGFKGTSERGGVIHDGACRKDFVEICVVWDEGATPVKFTKAQAADLYLEVMEVRDELMKKRELEKSEGVMATSWWYIGVLNRWWRRPLKYAAVRIAIGYYHKYTVMATYEEISA